MSELDGEQKKGLAAKLPDILAILASLAVFALAWLVFTNKIPKLYRWLYQHFYVLALVGVLGFLGEKISVVIMIFVLPVLLVGLTVGIKFRPEKFPVEDWWDIYALMGVLAAGFCVYLFYRWEETKKMKGLEGGGPLSGRVDPRAAAKYREEQARKDASANKLDGIKDDESKVKAKKKEEKVAEVVDPNETAEQRFEREMRQMKEEFSRKSMRLSTTLLRMKNLAKSLDRDEIFSTVLEIIAKGMDATRIQLLLMDDKEHKLRVVRAEGMPAKEYKDMVIPMEENSILGYLARVKDTKTLEGGSLGVKEAELDPKTKGLGNAGTLKTVLAAPILVDGKVFGVINVEKMRNPDYTRDDQALIATCADVAGLVMKNAKLYAATMDDLVSTKKLSEEQLKQNEQLKGSLSRIVSPRVAELILDNPSGLRLGGSKSEVTMFFSDIRGFTKMSESMDPTAIVELLNEYFTRMTDILMELDGTLDKYVGDEMMALFGAPVAQPSDPIRAVLCAVKMMGALRELQEKWKKEGKPIINIGIGINTGEVTAGYMGSEKQLSYTVIGDNVNLAARVMANAKPMQVLITKVVWDRVQEYFLADPLEPIMVKGKSKPIEIYEVKGVRDGVDFQKVIGMDVGKLVSLGAASSPTAPVSGVPQKQSSAPLNISAEEAKKVNIVIDPKANKAIECQNCGTENEAQNKFCSKCGMPIF